MPEQGTQPRRFWVETLGCPKNAVDSDKVTGSLLADGYLAADGPGSADLVVVNTCAFVEEARQESIDTILGLSDSRQAGAELVVTGCMAERYGAELAESLPEVDRVVGFGGPLTGPAEGAQGNWVPVTIGSPKRELPALDLLNMPRPAATAPWAYLKVAEGCDRACGFCAIPSFRGPAALPRACRRRSPRPRHWRHPVRASSSSSPRTWPPTGETRGRAPSGWCRCSTSCRPWSTGCGCCTCTPPSSPTS